MESEIVFKLAAYTVQVSENLSSLGLTLHSFDRLAASNVNFHSQFVSPELI